MRILGIDYGTKKIGLALSDESARFAFPHSILKNLTGYDLVKSIKRVCEENDVSKIILGRPELFKVKDDKIVKKVEKFKQILEKEMGIEVIFENEAMTTQQAKRPFKDSRKKPKNMDSASAALILQSYLDKNN